MSLYLAMIKGWTPARAGEDGVTTESSSTADGTTANGVAPLGTRFGSASKS
jgi:hypothetical protein